VGKERSVESVGSMKSMGKGIIIRIIKLSNYRIFRILDTL
jgi:hypothetical protein